MRGRGINRSGEDVWEEKRKRRTIFEKKEDKRMFIVAVSCSPRVNDGPEARELYECVQQVFPAALPPLDCLQVFHRNRDSFKRWATQYVRSEAMLERGANCGMTDLYDYTLHLEGGFRVHLHVRGHPRYDLWDEKQRPAEWQQRVKEERTVCDLVSIVAPDSTEWEPPWRGNTRITFPQITGTLKRALEISLPMHIMGYPDDLTVAASLNIRSHELRHQHLDDGSIHWLYHLQEPTL